MTHTLADTLHAETFGKPITNYIKDPYALRTTLRKAQRFILDDATSALLADLALDWRREMKPRSEALWSEMREAIGKGVPRNVAISTAVEGGAAYQAIGKELGLSRQRVHQIVSGG